MIFLHLLNSFHPFSKFSLSMCHSHSRLKFHNKPHYSISLLKDQSKKLYVSPPHLPCLS
jgi:hypothetical protein